MIDKRYTMPSYKLSYFDVRGNGELSRYVLLAAGVDFQDCRVSLDDWWTKVKPTTPFGQLPLLEEDGRTLAQGNAIARYLAREFNLVGKDSWEQALCDQYLEVVADLRREEIKWYQEQDRNKKEELNTTLLEMICPKFLVYFEKALVDNGGEYIVGNGLTVADLAVCCIFDVPLQSKDTLLDPYPKVKAHRTKIQALPKLSEYIKKSKPSII